MECLFLIERIIIVLMPLFKWTRLTRRLSQSKCELLVVVFFVFFYSKQVSNFPLKFKDKSCHFYLPFMVLVLISSCRPDGDGLDLLAPKGIGDSVYHCCFCVTAIFFSEDLTKILIRTRMQHHCSVPVAI